MCIPTTLSLGKRYDWDHSITFSTNTSSQEQDQGSSSPWSLCCIIVWCSPWNMCCIKLYLYDALPEIYIASYFGGCSPWDPIWTFAWNAVLHHWHFVWCSPWNPILYEPLLNSVFASLTFYMMLPLWPHISSKLIGTRRDRIIGTCLS